LRLGFGRFVLQNIPVSPSTPSVTRTTSAAIQFLGLPVPENRPWTIT
jgi:hypothetical protein